VIEEIECIHNNVKLSLPLFVRKESTTHFCFNWGDFSSAKPTPWNPIIQERFVRSTGTMG
jgi:hypothetical protein